MRIEPSPSLNVITRVAVPLRHVAKPTAGPDPFGRCSRTVKGTIPQSHGLGDRRHRLHADPDRAGDLPGDGEALLSAGPAGIRSASSFSPSVWTTAAVKTYNRRSRGQEPILEGARARSACPSERRSSAAACCPTSAAID